MHFHCGSCGLTKAEAPIMSFQHGCWRGNKVKRGAAPCMSPAWSQHCSRAWGHGQGGKSLTCHRVASQLSPACLGHGTGCSFGPDKVPRGCRHRARRTCAARPAGAAPRPLPSRAAWRGQPCRRLPGRPALLAAGGSGDAGPAPLESNYLPAASGPNPLTRRARSRLAKQGSIRLKCEVRISQKNESVVIAPASSPGRRSPAAAPSLSPALRPRGLLPGRLRLPGFVCLSGLPTGKPCRTVLLGRPAKRRAGRRAGGLAPAAGPLPAPRSRAWLLAEAPREPAAVGWGCGCQERQRRGTS